MKTEENSHPKKLNSLEAKRLVAEGFAEFKTFINTNFDLKLYWDENTVISYRKSGDEYLLRKKDFIKN